MEADTDTCACALCFKYTKKLWGSWWWSIDRQTLNYNFPLWGYSAVTHNKIGKTRKYTIIKLHRSENIYICYELKYYMDYKKCYSSYLRSDSKKVGCGFPFKTWDILGVGCICLPHERQKSVDQLIIWIWTGLAVTYLTHWLPEVFTFS